MELVFLALLLVILAFALGSGYPVAFALPGAASGCLRVSPICVASIGKLNATL